MIVAFTGGRDAKNTPQVRRMLALIEADLGKIDHVIVGDANGIDTMVRDYFKGKTRVTLEYAPWERDGKAAGHIRNGYMLDHNPDILVAFPGGIGTKNCKQQANSRGILVCEITEYMMINEVLTDEPTGN